jgi:hypothetical protein
MFYVRGDEPFLQDETCWTPRMPNGWMLGYLLPTFRQYEDSIHHKIMNIVIITFTYLLAQLSHQGAGFSYV